MNRIFNEKSATIIMGTCICLIMVMVTIFLAAFMGTQLWKLL